MNTLMLIDGNSLMNRAHFGLSGRVRLTSPEGVPTAAIMTFLNMVLQYMRQYEPTHLIVAFDRPEPTFRHLKYADYKGKRAPMPDDLVIQMHWIKRILDDWGTARAELAGYEADDLIGTYARLAEDAGMRVFIVTGDKDCFQLISDRTHVILPVTSGGQSTQEFYDQARFSERYGIAPEQFVDVKALMGDPSDNIPGVRGIGEKSALRLIAAHGTIGNLYRDLDAVAKAQREKLRAGEEDAMASRHLAAIECRIDPELLPVRLEDAVMPEPGDALQTTLLSLGLRQLLQRFGLTGPKTAGSDNLTLNTGTAFDNLSAFLAEIDRSQPVAVMAQNDKILLAGHAGYVWINRDAFAPLTEDSSFAWIVWDYKQLLHALDPLELAVLPFDAFIAQALIEPSSSQAPVLAHTYGRYFDSPLPESEEPEVQAVVDIAALSALHAPLSLRLKQDDLESVFWQIEMPLAPVLKRMEHRGIRVDDVRLRSLAAAMEDDIARLEKNIFDLAGHAFNLNSPKQLSEVLFQELKLPPGKKNRSGQYSTAQAELDRLEPDYPIIGQIKEHRLLSKLNQTFLQGLLREIGPDGRVHTTYTQVETATGRLSSVHPNLQNVPIRSERGRAIRDVFVADDGYVLLDADYSQIELRILAHLADDAKLKAAFSAHEDVHAVTASELFLIPPDKVTTAERAIAKTVNFSIVYGVGDFGLAQSLQSSVAEARAYIDAYNRLYKDVRAYLDRQIKLAYERGYVTTLTGRRRYMHELKSSNRNIRQFGERAAMNAPVQGTAADLIKLAMVRVENRLHALGLDARLLLQVHDELIVEASAKDAPEAAKALRESMEGAMQLSVELEADVSTGTSWGEAKS
ncbi:MAG TPA: DNA polymerase I [Clostridiaceae bacterium]|nr:DNA polymerase I [Clostridiaceae bacterium]